GVEEAVDDGSASEETDDSEADVPVKDEENEEDGQSDFTEELTGERVTLEETSVVYDGTEKTPAVTVKNAAGEVLNENVDYTLSYADNKLPGTASVTVTGTDDSTQKTAYKGTVVKTFTIDGWYTADEKTSYYKDGVKVTGWQTIDEKQYYFGTDGVLATGWQTIDDKEYYFGADGAMAAGWKTIGEKKYYFGTDGVLVTGWKTIGEKKYYFGTDGARVTGWKKVDGKKYYFGKSGAMIKGWKKIDGKKYYFGKSGSMITGWKKIDGKKYYFGTSGAMTKGWKKIGKKKYYFSTSGVMVTGQKKIDGYKYMFDLKTGAMVTGFYDHTKKTNAEGPKRVYYDSKGRMVFGQKTIKGEKYMFDLKTGAMQKGWYYHTKKTNGSTMPVYYSEKSGKMFKGIHKIGMTTFQFDEKTGELIGVLASDRSRGLPGYTIPYRQPKNGVRTLRNLLETALVPIGRTLWVWGGGHGGDANIMGMPQIWEDYFVDNASPGYQSSDDIMFWIGPDCSGYASWVVSNAFFTAATRPGSTPLAQYAAQTYASSGYGYISDAEAFHPGDVVSMDYGHVWFVIGKYDDGSVLLAHNSTKGCQLSGTGGEADKKARYYMAKYFPYWPYRPMTTSWYLGYMHKMTWNVGSFISDPDGFMDMGPDEIMKVLLGD
ncbi:MAG: N-acetylmuramoyl-L-alanine amidase family protein, partial [Eubacterium sp.]|nr:N-acetylmuramoyl-L-alanine amidase family protein [Eubacterium sp.]